MTTDIMKLYASSDINKKKIKKMKTPTCLTSHELRRYGSKLDRTSLTLSILTLTSEHFF